MGSWGQKVPSSFQPKIAEVERHYSRVKIQTGDLYKRVVGILGVTVLGGIPGRPFDGDYAY